MKKLFALFAVTGMLMFGASSTIFAQEENVETPDTTVVEADTVEVEAPATTAPADAEEEEQSIHKQIKTKFIEGGPEFMGIVLLVLILGLALSIERIIYLNLATTNTDKRLKKIEKAREQGGI